MVRSALFLAAVALLAAAAFGDVKFAQPVRVTSGGGQTRIAFEATAPTDVTVAVLDGAGNVVRHLAAGVLGGANPPPPPLQAGLAQSLAWDGKDDFGRALPAGGYKVRVGLGTQARLGKVLFGEPGLPHDPRAAAVGPDGLLYVLSEHAQAKSTFLLQAYTQDGKYVKTIMPYPANLPNDRLAGLPRTTMPDGRALPTVHHAGFRDLYPNSTGMRPQRMVITSKGWIVLVNASKTHNAGGPIPQRLLAVDTDGGTPLPGYVGPLAGAETIAHGFCWVAVSPDERWVYTSGQLKGNGSDDGFATPPHNVVYRIRLADWTDGKQPAKPLVGELFKGGQPGDDQAHLNGPRGLDTDAAGRIYVADHGNNRVAIFDADGKRVGKIDVANPDQVAVDRKTGAVYVLTFKPDRDPKKVEHRLIKFPAMDKPAGPAVDVGPPYCVMTLDGFGKGPPTLWLCRTFWESPAAKRGVEKVVDLGDRLSDPAEVIRHRPITDPYHIAASMVNDDVFVHGYSDHVIARVDGRTGEMKVMPKLTAHDVAVGPSGQLFTLLETDYGKAQVTIQQYDREGRPLDLPGGGNALKGLPGNKWGHGCTGSKAFSVSPRGEVLTLGRVDGEVGVWVFGPDGKLTSPAVRGVSGADGSPVMDLAGNLYVAVAAKPADEPFPAEFGRTPKDPPGRFYPWMYGAMIKFGPGGGRLFYRDPDRKAPWPPAGADKMAALASNLRGTDVLADGMLWCRGGFTVTPASNWSVGGCNCYTSRFCVDYYGRVFMPDNGLFAVRVLDNAGNPLMTFGDYGNEDSAGPGSKVPTPAIPFAWPYAVSVGRSGVYVCDFINRRILRVDLVPSAEQTCDVTPAGN